MIERVTRKDPRAALWGLREDGLASDGRPRSERLSRVVVVPGSGHWLMEEKPKETMAALEGFLK